MRTFSGLTSRRPFTLLGLLLAVLVIVAFVLVALNAQNATNNQSISVVVTTKALQPRVPIDGTSLTLKAISVPSDYQKVFFTHVTDVTGMVPLVDIGEGQAITANDVARPNAALGPQSEYLPIPSGYVALTIPTSEEQGVAGFVQPDDYISVIASVAVGNKVATKTIFTNLHVIKVGSAGGNNSPTSLTVVVTQCQAEVITWFLGYASLKYSLESYHDYLSSTAQSPDPACPSVNSAKGVTLQAMQAAYPTLF